MRLIDADTLKKALKSNCTPELCHDYNTAWCESCCLHNFFEDLIDNAPTVESDYEWGYSEGVHDTERPQGEWWNMQDDDLKISDFKCSVCNYWSDGDYNYCPNCGAKMGGDSK